MQGSSPAQALKRLRQVNHADDPATVFRASHPMARGQPRSAVKSPCMRKEATHGYMGLSGRCPHKSSVSQGFRAGADAEGECDWRRQLRPRRDVMDPEDQEREELAAKWQVAIDSIEVAG
jgi:hypothetical protein